MKFVECNNSAVKISSAKNIAYIGLMAALMTVCAWITIPTTVPFTLQTFALFFAVSVLGGKRGTIAVCVYIFIGAIGLPVFSGFKGGMGVLIGPTGGYIFGFILCALIVWIAEIIFGRKTLPLVVSMLIGCIAYFTFGTLWFMVVYTKASGEIGLLTVLSMCVFPFIIPDLLKMAVAVFLAKRIKLFSKI